MAEGYDIDCILNDWPYEPGEISARQMETADGREVLQMRVELGLLQLEIEGRPDGTRPGGMATYLDYLRELADEADFEPLVLSAEQCSEADREIMQFYHRRICWLALREFRRAATDADHTLAFMDFVRDHSPSEEWTLSHDQYRPMVLYHRTQAATLATLKEDGADAAMLVLEAGLERLREFFVEYDAEEQFDDDELVRRLHELRDTLNHDSEPPLADQLAAAVANEQYELAAKLRDEMTRRGESA